MRNIVPLDAADGIRMSASIEEFPGLTFLSFPNPAVELAETLAHEASHHHFLALQRPTPLHDGTDTKEYFSPIKQKGRRIELILYAFHAFANAAIYHRNLVRGGNPQYDRLNGRSLAEKSGPDSGHARLSRRDAGADGCGRSALEAAGRDAVRRVRTTGDLAAPVGIMGRMGLSDVALIAERPLTACFAGRHVRSGRRAFIKLLRADKEGVRKNFLREESRS